MWCGGELAGRHTFSATSEMTTAGDTGVSAEPPGAAEAPAADALAEADAAPQAAADEAVQPPASRPAATGVGEASGLSEKALQLARLVDCGIAFLNKCLVLGGRDPATTDTINGAVWPTADKHKRDAMQVRPSCSPAFPLRFR